MIKLMRHQLSLVSGVYISVIPEPKAQHPTLDLY